MRNEFLRKIRCNHCCARRAWQRQSEKQHRREAVVKKEGKDAAAQQGRQASGKHKPPKPSPARTNACCPTFALWVKAEVKIANGKNEKGGRRDHCDSLLFFRSAHNFARDHGGDEGRISWYSDVSSTPLYLAGTIAKSSFISSLAKIFLNFVMNQFSCKCPASCCNSFTSSAGTSRTRY